MSAAASRAPSRTPIQLTETDFEILAALLDAAPATLPGAALLAEEVGRARVAPDRRAPPGLVRLNSVVTYRDVATGQERRLQLGLPRDASIDDNRISVLTPVGAALIGLSVGQTFRWAMPNGRARAVTVVAVEHPDGG
jgi:regulator of nucleoside diphosphate kinase